MQEQVGREEIAHVRFAARWFRTFQGDLSFSAWEAALPSPLSPMVMRGRPLHRPWRLAAGLDDTFLDLLEAWKPSP